MFRLNFIFTWHIMNYHQCLTDLQSRSNACPFLPMTEMNWSIIPQGMLANVCSAFWQVKALLANEIGVLGGASCSRKVWVATSSDAELDNPPPSGTDVAIAALNGGTSSP